MPDIDPRLSQLLTKLTAEKTLPEAALNQFKSAVVNDPNASILFQQTRSGTQYFFSPILYAMQTKDKEALACLTVIPGFDVTTTTLLYHCFTETKFYRSALLMAIEIENDAALACFTALAGNKINTPVLVRTEKDGTEHYITPLLMAIIKNNQAALRHLMTLPDIDIHTKVLIRKDPDGTRSYITPFITVMELCSQRSNHVNTSQPQAKQLINGKDDKNLLLKLADQNKPTRSQMTTPQAGNPYAIFSPLPNCRISQSVLPSSVMLNV